jgi:hypothetical protein
MASPRSVLRIGLLATAALAVLLATLLVSQRETIRTGAEGYLFGHPLVMMDLTRRHAAATVAPENQLHRVRRFPDASFKGVVRPNVDTLYTSAFIDMDLGPWIFEIGPNDERYEVMPFMDAWTNVYAAPGTRTTDTGGGRFLLVGPTWQGMVPDGHQLLRSPTRLVWLIGRTQTNGVADYARVHRLQDALSLRRLTGDVPAPALPSATGPTATPPAQQMREMDTEAFFTRLAALMVDNPPAPADAPMLARLAQIGVAPGRPSPWGWLQRASVSLGRWVADFKIALELKKPRALVRGWATPPANLGQYGTDYATRAVVAMVGLGANLPADAMYPNAQVDSKGRPLDGSRRYRLHFAAGQLPPVKAFWSVTAYGADDFLIDNALGRHALGDRDPLVRNADGTLDLWIQADAPPAERQANWLPVKAGAPFLLNARLYWPLPEALDGRWGMPAIERLD